MFVAQAVAFIGDESAVGHLGRRTISRRPLQRVTPCRTPVWMKRSNRRKARSTDGTSCTRVGGRELVGGGRTSARGSLEWVEASRESIADSRDPPACASCAAPEVPIRLHWVPFRLRAQAFLLEARAIRVGEPAIGPEDDANGLRDGSLASA